MNKLIWLIYLIIFFLPSYQIRFKLPIEGTVNLLDLLTLTFLTIFCLWLTKEKKWENFFHHLFLRKWLLLSLGLMSLAAFASLLSNQSGKNSLSQLGIAKSYLILPITFSYSASYLISIQKITAQNILWAYWGYTLLITVISLSYLTLNKLTFDGRLSIFFESPNFLAMTLAPGILISLKQLKNAFFKKEKFIFIFISITVLQISSLISTQSLGALFGLSAAFLILFMPFKFLSTFKKLTLALPIIFLLILINLNFFLKICQYQPSVPANSFDSRIAIYRSSIKIIKDNWLWGIGLGNFQNIYLNYQKFFPPYPQWAVPHSHNLSLHLWEELGILGLIGFLFILWTEYKQKLTNSTDILIFSILTYFFIHGLFDTTIWKNDLAITFFLFLLLQIQAKKPEMKIND